MRLNPRSILNHHKRTIVIVGLLALLVFLSFMAGFVANQAFQDTKENFGILQEAHELLRANAYNPLPQESQLEYGMIRGMLAETNDPYTVFIEPSQHELQTNQLEGAFGGIGVRLEQDQDKNIFLYPLPNSPALQAGLQDGDRLISVENLQIDGYANTDQIQAAIRGKIGTQVELQVQRKNNADTLRFKVKRTEYNSPSVSFNLSPLNPTVGVIIVTIISETTPKEIERAILDLQSRGATAIILDLRNNGGGLVEAGIDTARLFLPEGEIIQEEFRGKGIQTYSVDTPGAYIDIPLAVLVNHNTASSAEILAVALQSQKRAIIVGTQTLGKETIQLSFTLSDQSSIHVTAGRWWVAGMDPSVDWPGLIPNIVLTDEEANGITAQQRAIQSLFSLYPLREFQILVVLRGIKIH